MKLLSLDAARECLAHEVVPRAAVEVSLADAAELVLARDVEARVDLPAFDTSAMDGYAVGAEGLARDLEVTVQREAPAGAVPLILGAGEVVRILTGARLPVGGVAVVPQEAVATLPNGRLRLPRAGEGDHVRRRGEVIRVGATVVHAGERLDPARIGLGAAVGVQSVHVVPKPRVAVVVTGGELVSAHEAVRLGPSQIYDSNGPMLAAVARASGLDVVRRSAVPDSLDVMLPVLEAASSAAELVLTSGGVSVGDYDLVAEALARLGAEVLFHGVAIKPGKPTLVARRGATYFVGLPGNPVAALCGWTVFARPLARRLAGRVVAFDEDQFEATLVAGAHNSGERELLLPSVVGLAAGRVVVVPGQMAGSHDLVGAGRANGFLRVPPRQRLEPGAVGACFVWGELAHLDTTRTA